MRTLILNAYSAGNRGDRMIVEAMVRLLEERGCEVRISSDDPDDGSRYSVPVVAGPIPVWPRGGSTPRVRMARGAARTLLAPASTPGLRWADLCVSAGGGYLYDDGSRDARVNLLRRLAILRAPRRLGKPVVLFSQSVGPFASRRLALLAAAELRRADLVVVRERGSFETCAALGVERVELADDAAFAFARPSEAAAGRRGTAVTAMAALPGRDARSVARYLEALRGALVRALEPGAPVVVASQVDAHASDTDVAVARRLASELAAAGLDASFADLSDLPDDELVDFYGRFEAVVASRLHSAILALCAGTPALALAYLPKTTGVYERLGLPSLALDLDALDGERLGAAVSDLHANAPAYRARLAEVLPELRRSAEWAADLTVAVGARSGSVLARG